MLKKETLSDENYTCCHETEKACDDTIAVWSGTGKICFYLTRVKSHITSLTVQPHRKNESCVQVNPTFAVQLKNITYADYPAIYFNG